MRFVLLVAFILIATAAARAEGPEAEGDVTIIYRNFKATLTVDSLAGLAVEVDALASRCGGVMTKLQVDKDGAATASLKVPAPRLRDLAKGLASLGRVDSEELETSDYSHSMRREMQKLRTYRAMSGAPVERMLAPLELSATDKAQAATDLRKELGEWARSAENSVRNHRDYLKYTFATITFHEPGKPHNASVVPDARRQAPWNPAPWMAAAVAAVIGFFVIRDWRRFHR